MVERPKRDNRRRDWREEPCVHSPAVARLGCNFDQCEFPKDDEDILPPVDLLINYFKKRKALDYKIDKTLAEIQRILGIDVKVDES